MFPPKLPLLIQTFRSFKHYITDLLIYLFRLYWQLITHVIFKLCAAISFYEINSFFRDYRSNRVALFDGIEEGRIHASPSYNFHENDRSLDGLHDRVNILKRVSNCVK